MMARPTREPGDRTVYACAACGGNLFPKDTFLDVCPSCEKNLAVYTDGIDVVIAADADDAARLVARHYETCWEDVEDVDVSNFAVLTKPFFSLTVEENGNKITRTVPEWIKEHGHGYLGSTEE